MPYSSTPDKISESSDDSMIDYTGFLELSNKLSPIRESHKVDLSTFINYAEEENTIVLDSRSVSAYNQRHFKGAINIPFADFTENKLGKIIPSKDTRILIYCNNNFIGDTLSMMLKAPPLALNIPTFINLHGYGYENIYELSGYVDINTPSIRNKWTGTLVQ